MKFRKKIPFIMGSALMILALANTSNHFNPLQNISLESIINCAMASGEGSSSDKTDAMAYCNSCNGRMCSACTTKYKNGCNVTENCTIDS